MKLRISFPSKTFLIGEYAVLIGGPAFLVNTRPRFQFHIQYPAKKNHPFHKESPAGLFIEENKKVFSSVSIQYLQTYGSGFGLSGAEFNCVYSLKVLLEGGSVKDISCFDILEKYLSYHSSCTPHSRGSGNPVLTSFPAKAGIQSSRHSHESGNPVLTASLPYSSSFPQHCSAVSVGTSPPRSRGSGNPVLTSFPRKRESTHSKRCRFGFSMAGGSLYIFKAIYGRVYRLAL